MKYRSHVNYVNWHVVLTVGVLSHGQYVTQ
jgi:hypothetical protein